MVETRESQIHGYGVFATGRLEAGRHLRIPYARLDEDDTDIIWNNSFDGWYPCPEVPWAYLNHSETPNAAVVQDETKLLLEALRDIERGEEVTIDYGPGYNWKLA